jgi:hypothetical protein
MVTMQMFDVGTLVAPLDEGCENLRRYKYLENILLGWNVK